MAMPLLHHDWVCSLDTIDHSQQVDGDDLVPMLELEIPSIGRHGNASVIEHIVEPLVCCDRVLDELYDKQSRATDPEARKQYIRQFEKRLLDAEAHYIMTLQWQRIIPHSAKVKGWRITPSHYLNQQLDTVWLAE